MARLTTRKNAFVVPYNQVLQAFQLTLADLVAGAQDAIYKAASETASKTSAELRTTSPSDTGAYRRSWTSDYKYTKIAGRKTYTNVVYNEEHYRLTHLLENGHVIRNKHGTYGTTKPQKHIEPAQDHAEQIFMSLVTRELKRIKGG